LSSVTLAPDTAPPLGSDTVPRIRPPVLCGFAFGAAAKKHIPKIAVSKEPEKHQDLLRRDTGFIDSPLFPWNRFPENDSSWL
jgi:hypothetical protein